MLVLLIAIVVALVATMFGILILNAKINNFVRIMKDNYDSMTAELDVILDDIVIIRENLETAVSKLPVSRSKKLNKESTASMPEIEETVKESVSE